MKKILIFSLILLAVVFLPAKTVEASYVSYGFASMTGPHTLTLQLVQTLPVSQYNGVTVCDYNNDNVCGTDYIVGPGGITYTYSTDGTQIIAANIDIKSSLVGTTVTLYPVALDSNNNPTTTGLGHTTATLTFDPLTVTGISTNGDRTVVAVGGYTLNNHNTYYCRLTGTTDNTSSSVWYGNGPEGSSPYILPNSCSFPTSEVNAIRNTNTSFNLTIIDNLDLELVTTQDYSFSQFPVPDAPPQISVQGETVNEGDTYSTTGSFIDSDSTSWTAQVNYGDGSGLQPLPLNQDKTFLLSHMYKDNGEYPVTVSVTDNQEQMSTASATVSVDNVQPTVSALNAPATALSLIKINTSSTFTDPGILDTHTAVWNWGDGTTSVGIVTENNGSGSVTGSHTYQLTALGRHTITLTVTDKDGGNGTSTKVIRVL